MWEMLIINSVLGLVSMLIKNPSRKAQYEAELSHLRDSLNTLYPVK